MIIAQSLWRKAIATTFAAAGFISLYEVTMIDSKYAARQALLRETTAEPSPGARLAFNATAYCKGVTTTSGVAAQTGMAAADPQLLPVGSVIEIDSIEPRYNGVYTIMDTGPKIQGRQVDIYMWSCIEALQFGRRPVRLVVIRLGWNPHASTRGFISEGFTPRQPQRLAPRPTAPGEAAAK
ncbi:MAG: 3D domain-containing protein [Acidobacteriota bacterium]